MLKNIQLNREIIGLKVSQYTYKYRAYTDDVMFILEDPLKTIPKLLEKVNKFGQLAGFYLNFKKTKVMCKNMLKKEEQELQQKIKCEVVNKVKYLDIYFTEKIQNYLKIIMKRLWKISLKTCKCGIN